MRWVLCLVLLAALGFAPAPVYRQKPDPAADDLALLQGKWIATMVKEDDEAPIEPRVELFLIVDRAVMTTSDDQQFRITLVATGKNRVMKLHEKGEKEDKSDDAFYRLDGDEWTMCFCTKKGVAPKSIAGGSGMEVWTFERYPKP